MNLVHLDDRLGSRALSSVEEVTASITYAHYVSLAAAIFLYYSRSQEEQIVVRELVAKWNKHRGYNSDDEYSSNWYGRGPERLNTHSVFKYYKKVVNILGKPPHWDAERHCSRTIKKIVTDLKLPSFVHESANQYLKTYIKFRKTKRHTNVLAAASVYLACQEKGFKNVTQQTLSELAGCTKVALRANMRSLAKLLGDNHELRISVC